MRKGEPTTSLGLAIEHSRGNARGPELPHATCLPGGSLPTGYPLPFFPGFIRAKPARQSIQGGRDARTLAADHLYGPLQTPRAGDSWVYALSPQKTKTVSRGPRYVGAWGNLCQARLPSEGNLPLTAKSLSATTVYHVFAFPSPQTLFQHKMSLKGRSCWVVNICMDDAGKLSSAR
jgi:hypothetical protein